MIPAARTRQPPPGSRVVIRDAEWVVRRVDTTASGGAQLACVGVSELVREREAVFLTTLDDSIEILDPETTRLVADDTSRFRRSRLYMESLRRQAVANDDRIHIAQGAAMDQVPYQLDPARQALRQPRQRILIADDVGLGKTVEAGILLSELIARGRGKRILAVTVKSMLTQFQKELWSRFTIPLTRLDSAGIQRVRRHIPTNHNPFHYYDKAIISVDTLKQAREYRTYVENAFWDIIVIDEAHNVADRGTGSLRSRLAKLLARRSDTLILLSATPHDGRARSFASLVNMLDATAIGDPDDFTQEDFRNKGLVIRRFKKDVRAQVQKSFRDRKVIRRRFSLSPLEEAAAEALLKVPVLGDRDRGARRLFSVVLEKAFFSSPAACRETISERCAKLEKAQKTDSTDAANANAQELAGLRALDDALAKITPKHFTKYQALLNAVQGGEPFDWKPSRPRDRLVVFTERIATLNWLRENLQRDLRLHDRQIAILSGSLSDLDQQQIVENFGNEKRPVRLLLASDVASEGINLHH